MPHDPLPGSAAPQCECIQRGMTGGKAHPLCPVHGPRDACFELDGARVHGDPNMSDESREALQEIIAATRQRAEQECCTGCGHMLASHGTAGCTARVSRHGTCQCGEPS